RVGPPTGGTRPAGLRAPPTSRRRSAEWLHLREQRGLREGMVRLRSCCSPSRRTPEFRCRPRWLRVLPGWTGARPVNCNASLRLQPLGRPAPTSPPPRPLRTRARRPAKHSDPMPREESHPDGRRHQLPSLLVQLFEGLLKMAHLLVYPADQAGALFRSVGPTGRVLPESERVHDFSFDPIGEGL